MTSGSAALLAGMRRAGRSWGLGILLLGVNLGTALLLAVPLAGTLAREFHERPSGTSMEQGFDFPWWSHWSDTRSGWHKTLGPELLGAGFAMKNVDLLLGGQLPGGLFARPDADGKRVLRVDPLILTVACAYMLLQVFLAGGVFAVLRQAQASWTMRGVLHGAGFYFGRFLRVWALMMLAMAILFALYHPFARWAAAGARESVSGAAADAWLLGGQGALLAAILFLHVVGTYARAVIVLEDRTSATLAVLSALAFALAHLPATITIAGALAILGGLSLALWQVFDQAWATTGIGTQALTLLAMQALVLARVLLRVALAGALMDLYRRRTAESAPLTRAA